MNHFSLFKTGIAVLRSRFMDNNTVSRLQTAGISEKRAKQLATPSLASTCEALLTLFTEVKSRKFLLSFDISS